jgi:hypothetical protein
MTAPLALTALTQQADALRLSALLALSRRDDSVAPEAASFRARLRDVEEHLDEPSGGPPAVAELAFRLGLKNGSPARSLRSVACSDDRSDMSPDGVVS